jgi:hypothetical protein
VIMIYGSHRSLTNRSRATIASLTPYCLAPKAPSHFKPGASPQEFELPCKQGLKARFITCMSSIDVVRFKRAGRARHSVRAVAEPEGGVQRTARPTKSVRRNSILAVHGRPGPGWPNRATNRFCNDQLSSVSIHWLPARGRSVAVKIAVTRPLFLRR